MRRSGCPGDECREIEPALSKHIRLRGVSRRLVFRDESGAGGEEHRRRRSPAMAERSSPTRLSRSSQDGGRASELTLKSGARRKLDQLVICAGAWSHLLARRIRRQGAARSGARLSHGAAQARHHARRARSPMHRRPVRRRPWKWACGLPGRTSSADLTAAPNWQRADNLWRIFKKLLPDLARTWARCDALDGAPAGHARFTAGDLQGIAHGQCLVRIRTWPYGPDLGAIDRATAQRTDERDQEQYRSGAVQGGEDRFLSGRNYSIFSISAVPPGSMISSPTARPKHGAGDGRDIGDEALGGIGLVFADNRESLAAAVFAQDRDAMTERQPSLVLAGSEQAGQWCGAASSNADRARGSRWRRDRRRAWHGPDPCADARSRHRSEARPRSVTRFGCGLTGRSALILDKVILVFDKGPAHGEKTTPPIRPRPCQWKMPRRRRSASPITSLRPI